MDSRWLWNSHQSHKFLQRHSKFQNVPRCLLGNGVSRGFQSVFSTADTMFFRQNTHETGNNALKISKVFHDIIRLERFTDLNLFKYAFNVI